MSDERRYGAVIERGEIVTAGADGYTVRSFDRYAITTRAIRAIGNAEYSVGDTVYYFMFPDGNGMILSALPTS